MILHCNARITRILLYIHFDTQCKADPLEVKAIQVIYPHSALTRMVKKPCDTAKRNNELSYWPSLVSLVMSAPSLHAHYSRSWLMFCTGIIL